MIYIKATHRPRVTLETIYASLLEASLPIILSTSFGPLGPDSKGAGSSETNNNVSGTEIVRGN